MRSILFLTLAMISVSVLGGNVEEKITIQKIDTQYSINYFNYKASELKYFETIGLQGGGYTWVALIKAVLENESPELMPQIEFDPEGDAFFAYAASEDNANRIKAVIERLSSDINYREKYIKIATDGGYIE